MCTWLLNLDNCKQIKKKTKMTDFFGISDVVFVVGVVGVAQTSVGPEFKLQEFVPKFALPKKRRKKDMEKRHNFPTTKVMCEKDMWCYN